MWFRGLLVNTSFLEEYILTPEGDTVVYIGPSWTSLVYLFIWCVLYLLCVCVCVCVYVLSHFSHIQIFVTVWTVVCQATVHGVLQERILEWVAIPSSRGIFLTQGLNPCLLCLLHWQLGSLPLVPPGKPILSFIIP